jgi:hypothetical protein
MIAPRIVSVVAALVLTAPLDLLAQHRPAIVPGDRVNSRE